MVESAGLFADYLASLPAAQLDRLYSSLYTCQARCLCNPTTLPTPHSHRTTPPSFPPRMLLAPLTIPLSPLPLPQLSPSCRTSASLPFLPAPLASMSLPPLVQHGVLCQTPCLTPSLPHPFLPQCTSHNPQHPHTHLPPFLPLPSLPLFPSTSVRSPSHHRSRPPLAKQHMLPLLFLTNPVLSLLPPATLFLKPPPPRFPTSHRAFPCCPAPHTPRPHRSLSPLAKKYVLPDVAAATALDAAASSSSFWVFTPLHMPGPSILWQAQK
ncbi:unnamed protein product, partial [Closterium sp. Naga37s-1]